MQVYFWTKWKTLNSILGFLPKRPFLGDLKPHWRDLKAEMLKLTVLELIYCMQGYFEIWKILNQIFGFLDFDWKEHYNGNWRPHWKGQKVKMLKLTVLELKLILCRQVYFRPKRKILIFWMTLHPIFFIIFSTEMFEFLIEKAIIIGIWDLIKKAERSKC
mgnify:CR=1 FL=1